jgi:hypothetical protein
MLQSPSSEFEHVLAPWFTSQSRYPSFLLYDLRQNSHKKLRYEISRNFERFVTFEILPLFNSVEVFKLRGANEQLKRIHKCGDYFNFIANSPL